MDELPPLVHLSPVLGTMRRYFILFAFILGCRDCSPPTTTTDIGPVDASTLPADSTSDAYEVDVDILPAMCPEAVEANGRGEPIGVVSHRIRHCWPVEAHCFCDMDGDCYAQEGYLPCAPASHDF